MKYIGIPFEYNGRNTDGIDCLGLVQLYLKDHGYNMPSGDGRRITEGWHDQDPERLREGLENFFIQVDNKPQKFDVLLFELKGKLRHLGVMHNMNQFLHIYKGQRSNLERLPNWKNLHHATYRHRELI